MEKEILNDWHNEFPDLTKFGRNKLYKIIGPLIVGIELIAINRMSGYRPYFVIYPLWENKYGNNLQSCLVGPTVLLEVYDNKNLPFDIRYSAHGNLFTEAIRLTKQQMLLPFTGDAAIELILKLVERHQHHFLIDSHSGRLADLFELQYNCSLYTNSLDKANETLDSILRASKIWNMQQFKMSYGDFDEWFIALQQRKDQMDKLLASITSIKNDRKLNKVKESELIA